MAQGLFKTCIWWCTTQAEKYIIISGRGKVIWQSHLWDALKKKWYKGLKNTLFAKLNIMYMYKTHFWILHWHKAKTAANTGDTDGISGHTSWGHAGEQKDLKDKAV